MWLKIKQLGQSAGFCPCFHLPGLVLVSRTQGLLHGQARISQSHHLHPGPTNMMRSVSHMNKNRLISAFHTNNMGVSQNKGPYKMRGLSFCFPVKSRKRVPPKTKRHVCIHLYIYILISCPFGFPSKPENGYPSKNPSPEHGGTPKNQKKNTARPIKVLLEPGWHLAGLGLPHGRPQPLPLRPLRPRRPGKDPSQAAPRVGAAPPRMKPRNPKADERGAGARQENEHEVIGRGNSFWGMGHLEGGADEFGGECLELGRACTSVATTVY